MSFLKRNSGAIAICLFEVLIGVLLLINPVGFTAGIIIAVGFFLAAGGIYSIIQYFQQKSEDAAIGQGLFKGLVLLLAGLFCVLKSKWFIITFPVLTILYGVGILLVGLRKIQWTVDLLRLKRGKWGWAAASAVLSIAAGVVVLHNPFTSTAVLWMFAGICFIVDAVFDVVVTCISGGKNK